MQELLGLVGIAQSIVGRRFARFSADEHADAAPLQRPERILIGDVIADIDGHHIIPIEVQGLQ